MQYILTCKFADLLPALHHLNVGDRKRGLLEKYEKKYWKRFLRQRYFEEISDNL